MTDKKSAPDVTASKAQVPTNTTDSITTKAALDKMHPLTRLREGKGIQAADLVGVVQELYPGFDRYLLSQAEETDYYGIDLRQDAMTALYAAYAPEMAPKLPRKERRRLTHRIYGRLNKADYDALQGLIKARGYQSMQDWLLVTVRRTLAMSKWHKEGRHE